MADSCSDPSTGDNWSVDCSDDEKYEISKKWITVGGMEIPPAEDIASLHEVLCIDRVLALEWRCLGRRPQTPEGRQNIQPETTSSKLEIKNDDFFDFDMDDMSTQLKMPVRRREGELKGGARKKTTSFDGVISNMKRFWKMDNEQQAQQTTTPQPPNPSPSSS